MNLQVDDDDQSVNDEPPIPPARKTKVSISIIIGNFLVHILQ